MKFTPMDPPRVFEVGHGESIPIKDCGHMQLEPGEQVTFVTESGAEYDVARKSWGFYATPSLNGRLPQFGLRPVLVKSKAGKYYIWLLERGRESDFQRYLDVEGHEVLQWLDSTEELTALERRIRGG